MHLQTYCLHQALLVAGLHNQESLLPLKDDFIEWTSCFCCLSHHGLFKAGSHDRDLSGKSWESHETYNSEACSLPIDPRSYQNGSNTLDCLSLQARASNSAIASESLVVVLSIPQALRLKAHSGVQLKTDFGVLDQSNVSRQLEGTG